MKTSRSRLRLASQSSTSCSTHPRRPTGSSSPT
jgi:hypothetical protein